MKKLILFSILTLSTSFAHDEIRLFTQTSEESCWDAREMAKSVINNEELMKGHLARKAIALEDYRGHELGSCVVEKRVRLFFIEETIYTVAVKIFVHEDWLNKQDRFVTVTTYGSRDLEATKTQARNEVESGQTIELAKVYKKIDPENIMYATSFMYSQEKDERGFYYIYKTVVVLKK